MTNVTLKKFAVFLLPLLLYIVAEQLWGVWVAVALSALLPMAFIVRYLVNGKGNVAHHISDLVLIALFALIELLPCPYAVCFALMGILLILSGMRVISLFKIMGISDSVWARNPYAVANMQSAQRRMGVWCILGATLFAVSYAYFPQTDIAQWTDNWGLFAIILCSVATEILVGRINYYRYRNAEWVPLVSEDGKVVGQCPRPLVHNGSLWLHPVVHLHVLSQGKLLLQLRPLTKKIQPGKWDTAVGGHIAAGETIEKALGREVWEEIGLRNFEAKLLKTYTWQSTVEHEYVFSFITNADGPFITKNIGEVDELRFWSKEELVNNIGKDVFTLNLEKELVQLILPNI